MSDKVIDLFSGPDGALSLRRIIGCVFFLVGLVLLVITQFQTGDWFKFIPACISFTVGLILFGLVTAQNITDALKK